MSVALSLLKQSDSKEPKKKTKDKDGDDESTNTVSVNIDVVDNGFVITTEFEDGSTAIEVFDNDGNDDGDKQTMQCIIDSLGLNVKVK